MLLFFRSSLPRRPNTEYHHYSSTSVVSTSFTCLWNTCSSKVSVIVEHLYYKSCSSKVSTKMMNNEDLLNSGGQSSTSASQTALVKQWADITREVNEMMKWLDWN
ncbi:uncharacterized protein LOC117133734 [Brassica rapa]|uniref:uncharacterized protein LOC117133734 n=1 Tax=Brassica campestris TaxID=3711 RepID=UPI00142DA4E1|nr:uncharacterized protein LOC103863164 isoform X1 [Brassica rapa]XP_033146575.1 uncharacterized protein LOC117133734 [Brassica rapa]